MLSGVTLGDPTLPPPPPHATLPLAGRWQLAVPFVGFVLGGRLVDAAKGYLLTLMPGRWVRGRHFTLPSCISIHKPFLNHYIVCLVCLLPTWAGVCAPDRLNLHATCQRATCHVPSFHTLLAHSPHPVLPP